MATVTTILANLVNLWLVQALESKIDTLEINKRPGGGALMRSPPLGVSIQILNYEKLHYRPQSERAAVLQNKEMDVDCVNTLT